MQYYDRTGYTNWHHDTTTFVYVVWYWCGGAERVLQIWHSRIQLASRHKQLAAIRTVIPVPALGISVVFILFRHSITT